VNKRELQQQVQQQQHHLNHRPFFNHLSQHELAGMESQLRTGDFVDYPP